MSQSIEGARWLLDWCQQLGAHHRPRCALVLKYVVDPPPLNWYQVPKHVGPCEISWDLSKWSKRNGWPSAAEWNGPLPAEVGVS